MLENEAVAIFVIDRGEALHGVIGLFVSPVWVSDGALLAQEAFWWCERSGASEATALLQAAEDWARDRGAVTLCMVRLEGLRDEAVDRLYRRRSYEPLEHLYARPL